MSNQFKRHCILILDDENTDNETLGWKRVIKLFLKEYHYIQSDVSKVNIVSEQTELSEEQIEIHFFEPKQSQNFDFICEYLSDTNNYNDFDIFFIDINWDNKDAIEGTKIVNEKKDIAEFSIEELKAGKIPSNIAGVYLLNHLPKDNKPKIVFSGSDKTELLRKYFYLIQNRVMTDDILIGELKIDSKENYGQKIESKIQKYLLKKQIKILNYTSAEIKENLNKAIDNDRLSDEILIPDLENKEDSWTLKTLFPNRVNKIEANIDKIKNAKELKEIINNLNFRSLYKWLVFDHGQVDGITFNTIDKTILENRIKTLEYIESDDFIIINNKPKEYYTKFEHFKLPETDQKNYIDELIRIKISDFFNEPNRNFGHNISGKWYTDLISSINPTLVKGLGEFGIYLGDIYFVYACIRGNNKHNFTERQAPKEGEDKYNPAIVFNIQESEASIEIKVDSNNEVFENNNYSNALARQKTKIARVLAGNEFKIHLKEEALDDFVPLMIKRYNAKVEIQFGKKVLKIENRICSKIIENKSLENSTKFTFKISKV